MLDTRNTSITFLPLSDGEQLTLRNQLDSRLKQLPQPEFTGRAQPEQAKDKTEAASQQAFDRSTIEKIYKLWQVKDNDKSKDIREEVKLRPGRKLAPGTYEIDFKQHPDDQALNHDRRTFRIHIPKACPAGSKVVLVLAGSHGQAQSPSCSLEAAQTDEVTSDGKEKCITVTAITESPSDKRKAKTNLKKDTARFVSNDLVTKHEQQQSKVIDNDDKYLAGIIQLTSELTNATVDPLGWSWTGD